MQDLTMHPKTLYLYPIEEVTNLFNYVFDQAAHTATPHELDQLNHIRTATLSNLKYVTQNHIAHLEVQGDLIENYELELSSIKNVIYVLDLTPTVTNNTFRNQIRAQLRIAISKYSQFETKG